MEILRYELYQNLNSLFSNFVEGELETKVVDYLYSLDSYRNKELLKTHSEKLKDLKGKLDFYELLI